MINEKDTKSLAFFSDQEDLSNNNKQKKTIFESSLLLKQTLISAWKSKLQLVILLLLTSFSTSLITGAWISYQRFSESAKTLQLDEANFDAVLPYSSTSDITQIANQAFSLSLGKIFYKTETSTAAIYYDNTIIGKEIKDLEPEDLKITFTKDGTNKITGIDKFEWANPSNPLKFNLDDKNVQASIYGQLMTKYNKAKQAKDFALANNYLDAANNLYQDIFVNFSAPQILASIETYFIEWINQNPSELNTSDKELINCIVKSKINYRGNEAKRDLRIPSNLNLLSEGSINVLEKLLVKKDDSNPRATSLLTDDYGMNGQWMRIYRKFDFSSEPKIDNEVLQDLVNSYSSDSNYNMMTDSSEPYIYSYALANAVAALQNRSIHVVNQFGAASGVDHETGKSINVKVVDLGLEHLYNKVNLEVFEGIRPLAKNQVAISPQYARYHGIKPGQWININTKPFIVSAIAADAYNIYPVINSIDTVPNTRNEFIVYVLPDAFYDSSWYPAREKSDISLMYFLPWKNTTIPEFNNSYFDDYFQKRIFGNNKLSDNNQDQYNSYLIDNYIENIESYLQEEKQYQIERNLVVSKSDGQFSIYDRGRILFDYVVRIFKVVSFAGVIFLTSVIIFITFLIVKKAIQKNQVSMGILKSSGYSTKKIMSSFLAYPIIVLLIAIPVGWIFGIVIQFYFTEIFNTIFSLPYNVLSIKFMPLLISAGVICGFVLITTLLTSYKILQKQPLDLIKPNSDIAETVPRTKKQLAPGEKMKDSFKFRFLLALSRTSWKKIIITAIVIAVATLSITATVSIPATINNMKNNYFKSQKYKNYYQYQTPIPNMPLSKYGLYSWTNLNNPNEEKFYPVRGIMPWPDEVIVNNKSGEKQLGWYDPLEYDKKDDGSFNFGDIFRPNNGLSDEEKDKIIKQIQKNLESMSNGPLVLDYLGWSFSWMGGRGFSNSLLKDVYQLDKSINKSFSASLITFASTILPGILGVDNPGVPSGMNAIVEILKQTLPGFVRQILDSKGDNAYDYFSIGHNTVAYNPNYNKEIGGAEEELVTQFQIGSADRNLVNNGFLDVEGINPKTKMLVMNSNLVNELKYKSNDSSIPMVVNKSFAAKFNLKQGSTFEASPNVKTLYYKNNKNKFVPLPKANWYYGSEPLNNNEVNKEIWSKSANKWSYRGQKDIDSTDYKDSYGYTYDGVYDKDGKQINSEIPKPWNDINQIWLKLPQDISAEALSGTLREAELKENFSFDVVKNIGKKIGEYTWIKPFSFDVTDKYKGSRVDPIGQLMTRIPEWYAGMLDKGVLVVENNLHSDSLADDIENKQPIWWQNIVGKPYTKYHVIGIQESYDTPRAYIDQKWANLILGYSYFNDNSDDKDPLIENSNIYQWFSGKLSASDDIYDIIGRMSFKRASDDYSMYGMTWLNGNSEEQLVANYDLLLKKKEMLQKMSTIAFTGSLLFIITTVICSILIVIMITDSFTDQFRKFMAQMKAEGYSNKEINSFTLGIFTPWVFVGYGLGYGLGYLIVFLIIKAASLFIGLAFPFAFIWWIIPVSLGLIALIYFSTFIINNAQLNNMNLISLLKTDE